MRQRSVSSPRFCAKNCSSPVSSESRFIRAGALLNLSMRFTTEGNTKGTPKKRNAKNVSSNFLDDNAAALHVVEIFLGMYMLT